MAPPPRLVLARMSHPRAPARAAREPRRAPGGGGGGGVAGMPAVV